MVHAEGPFLEKREGSEGKREARCTQVRGQSPGGQWGPPQEENGAVGMEAGMQRPRITGRAQTTTCSDWPLRWWSRIGRQEGQWSRERPERASVLSRGSPERRG